MKEGDRVMFCGHAATINAGPQLVPEIGEGLWIQIEFDEPQRTSIQGECGRRTITHLLVRPTRVTPI